MNGETVDKPFQYEENDPLSKDHLKGTVVNGFQCWDNSYPYLSNSKSCIDFEDECDSSDSRPRGERWPPLGAPNDESDISATSENKWYTYRGGSPTTERERLRELEEEQEQLNNSLLALTSHFAQVQFRLKQIVDASPSEKETLLVELEKFANRGIPDLRSNVIKSPKPKPGSPETRLDLGHERQRELIGQLKQQLEDLENYAYQTGEAGLPQSIILQKQRAIIDQLKGKLNLNVDDFDKLTIEDLKSQVDKAIKELINPLRMKEQLVSQLQTQIVDLERFIEFLQDNADEPFSFKDINPTSNCQCDGHLQSEAVGGRERKYSGRGRANSFRKKIENEQVKMDTKSLIQRATTVLSMLTLAHFSCGSNPRGFDSTSMNKESTVFHWGNLRAKLEVAIGDMVDAVETTLLEDTACEGVVDDERSLRPLSGEAVMMAVRKRFCPALRDLIQHGLMPVGQSQSLVPFLSCLPNRSMPQHQLLHAWDFILKYYYLKKGDQYNRTPARQLSQSYNLEITGGSPITNKQLLLQTIGTILSSHGPLKRSYDSHFKAFISAALNKKKLITWLRLIFRTQMLVENYYQPWSYVAKTGFEDTLRSLEQFNKYNFNLSVDLALKPFLNIRDVFS